MTPRPAPASAIAIASASASTPPPVRVLLAGGAALRAALREPLGAEPALALVEAGDEAGALAALAGGLAAALVEAAALPAAAAALRGAGHAGPLLRLVPAGEAEGPDALALPLRYAALIARLRPLLAAPAAREAGEQAGEQAGDVALGAATLRPSRRLLLTPGGALRLTEKEVALLAHLAAAAAPVTREALLAAVWGYAEGVDSHTAETHVYRLRRKLEADPATAGMLASAPGGYRLERGA